MELLFSSSSESVSSSSTESDEEQHVKVSGFIETIKAYSEKDFKRHFRLYRSTVMNIIGMRTH